MGELRNSSNYDGNNNGVDNKKSIMKKKDQFKVDSTLDTYDGHDLLVPKE